MEKTKATIAKYWGTSFEAEMEKMPQGNSFTVETFDGLQLKGTYFTIYDSSNCAIILAHGWGAIWADMLKYVPVFSTCNCDLIFYDHRVHGASEGQYATGGIKESKDLWSITNWVKETKGYELANIGWMGSSWGAATAIIAGTESENVGFIMADSPFQDWNSAVFERARRDYGSGINLIAPGVMQVVNLRAGVNYKNGSPVNVVSKVEEPILLIHSQGDLQTSSTQSVNISKNLDSSNSTFIHTEWGNDHVMDVINNTTDFQMIVHDFIRRKAPQFLKTNN